MSYIARRTEGGQTLAFTFHGTGGNENQFHTFADQLLPGASVVSPRGDVSEMGALRYFRRTGEGVYDMADLARRTEAMATFMTAERARVGATRTVGLGYSNGANILSAVAFLHPELVDEVILLHPLIPWEPAPQPGLEGRRVLITAGQRDPICPPPLTERLARWFEAQGAEVTLDWHPGGHEIAQTEIAAIQRFLSPVAA
jgi:phospholipase/carboxylesterase